VLDRATAVSEMLVRKLEREKRKLEAANLARRRNLVLTLKETLIRARDGNMEDGALRPWLSRLQDEFVNRMATWDAEDMCAPVATTDGQHSGQAGVGGKQMEDIMEIGSDGSDDDGAGVDDSY